MPNLVQFIHELTAGWHRSARKTLVIFAGGVVVAVLMSTQLLFQPFVWRNWDFGDIMQAWLDLLRDRLIVSMTMATMLATLGQMSGPAPLARTVLAIFVGAGLGEWVLLNHGSLEDRPDLVSVLGRVIRWSIVGGAIAATLHLWRAEAELVTAAQEAGIEAARSRRLAATVRIGILRQQIEPHFLLNTLATIRRLHETDYEHGQHLLGRLFQYMSATLSSVSDGPSTLEREIALVRAYLDVCASRMDGRLIVRWEVPAALQARQFPPLILATLAENADQARPVSSGGWHDLDCGQGVPGCHGSRTGRRRSGLHRGVRQRPGACQHRRAPAVAVWAGRAGSA